MTSEIVYAMLEEKCSFCEAAKWVPYVLRQCVQLVSVDPLLIIAQDRVGLLEQVCFQGYSCTAKMCQRKGDVRLISPPRFLTDSMSASLRPLLESIALFESAGSFRLRAKPKLYRILG